MRLRSINPKYLDQKWLLALWREGLGAKRCLETYVNGWTCWYINHPQLERFKKLRAPDYAIQAYLSVIYKEAESRGYNFNEKLLDWRKINIYLFDINGWDTSPLWTVNNTQLSYEREHLMQKILIRDRERYHNQRKRIVINDLHHPLFKVIQWPIENREKI